jgi:hypothetical protein
MWTRRRLLTRGCLAMLGAAGTCFALPGDDAERGGDRESIPDGSASRGMITFKTDEAIDRGLSYLRDKNSDGAFGSGILQRGHVAVSSLAGLAFLAGGHQPGHGPYGGIVTSILKFVLSQGRSNNPKGYLFNPNAYRQQGMYGHGFGTLFLAEVSGMVHTRELRNQVHGALRDAVQVIVKSQNAQGGWRYEPTPTEADLSVTVCQMMALRAARNAGVGVSRSVADKCVEYVRRCQDRTDGSFRYQPGFQGPPVKFARTAAGVSALNSAGVYKGEEIDKGLAFMQRSKPNGLNQFGRNENTYYFYGHYYAVQAMWTAGGEYWEKWYPAIREELISSQNPDGSWHDSVCPHYATAMACIILQVPNNYLPILQK